MWFDDVKFRLAKVSSVVNKFVNFKGTGVEWIKAFSFLAQILSSWVTFLKEVFVQASIRDKDIFLDFFFTRVFIAETDMMRVWLAYSFSLMFLFFLFTKKKKNEKRGWR